jgi:butyrate kinase
MQLMLIINPGSTSTKLAIYDGTKLLKEETIYHSNEELKSFSSINDQIQFRQNLIKKFIQKNKFDLQDFNVVVARGGLLRPIPGGVYTINQPMLADLKSAKYGSHASNLGAMIAYELALPYKLPAFIVDPVVTDELSDMARISGSKLFPRRSVFHALNQKAVARKYANSINRKYESLNLIVCHLGGGITVG